MNPFPNGFITLERGGASPYPAHEVAGDGVRFNVNTQCAELVVWIDKPTEVETIAYRRGAATFGLYTTGPVIFFLCRFDPLPWMDAPYSARLVPKERRGFCEGFAVGARVLLEIMLIDSSNNRIAAMRSLTLTPAFSEALAGAVAKQLTLPFVAADYDHAISRAYRRHSTTAAMVRQALIVDSDAEV